MVQGRRHVFAEQRVEQENSADQRQGDADHPARRLEHQGDDHDAHDEIGGSGVARPLDQVGVEDPVIEPQGEAEAAQEPAGQPDMGRADALGEEGEGQQQQEADMDAAHDHGRQGREGGGPELEGGKGQGDPHDRPTEMALAER